MKQTSWDEFFTHSEDSTHPLESDEKFGFFLEVDFSYPPELHHEHGDFPLAPSNITITGSNLSEESRRLLDLAGRDPTTYRSSKLMNPLTSRESYIIHHKVADLYSELGLNIHRVRRAVKFVEKPFLKKWVDL